MSRSVLLLILGAVAALLSWLGISTFRPDPTVPPAATERASNSSSGTSASFAARTKDSPVVSDEPLPKPATETTINEVIPDIPRSALETIRGTVRVSVRVIVDKQGAVVDAAADDRGPSRYFERLAVEASKNWTFTPANSEERRLMRVRFNFTRAGVTADASPLQ